MPRTIPSDDSRRDGPRQGYTGHEHDDEFGLINMKGRIYDPEARRFLTPDPIQDASIQPKPQPLQLRPEQPSHPHRPDRILWDPPRAAPGRSPPGHLPRDPAPDRPIRVRARAGDPAIVPSPRFVGAGRARNPVLNGSFNATPTPTDAEPTPSSDDDTSSTADDDSVSEDAMCDEGELCVPGETIEIHGHPIEDEIQGEPSEDEDRGTEVRLFRDLSYYFPTGLGTVIIITKDWGIGTHAALYVDNSGEPILFDPGGSYGGRSRIAGAYFLGTEANLQNYFNYQQEESGDVDIYRFTTTRAQEAALVERIVGTGGEAGEGEGGFLSCALHVSSVGAGTASFEELDTSTPGGLGRDLRDIQNGTSLANVGYSVNRVHGADRARLGREVVNSVVR